MVALEGKLSKNSRAVLMLNKYQNINTEVMYSIPEV
jgi:hypothetical protein